MSFPESFGSQLSAIMEALLKAVVAEVTALVEDGAVELRLGLRDRDRQILEKEREIEERGRVIEELRAAVEEFKAREDAAVSPAEIKQEKAGGCVRTKEEEDTIVVKSEPTEEFTAGSTDSRASLLPPLSTTTATADTAGACSFETNHKTAQSYSQWLQETEQPNQRLERHSGCDKRVKIRNLNAKKRNCGVLRCDRCDQKTFKCDQCEKMFTAKCRLLAHQSVHTGVKLFSCRKCGKKFSRKDNCLRHQKSDPRCKDGKIGRI